MAKTENHKRGRPPGTQTSVYKFLDDLLSAAQRIERGELEEVHPAMVISDNALYVATPLQDNPYEWRIKIQTFDTILKKT